MKRDGNHGTCPTCGNVTDNEAVSWGLRKLIESSGVTQIDIAVEMKVSGAYLSDLLNCRKDWRPELIERVRNAVRKLATEPGVKV